MPQMNINLEKNLKHILRIGDKATKRLQNRENSQIEFKQTFNLGSMSDYAKTMAAFANADGGYIIFGVKPTPHILIGVNIERFEATDSAKISQFLNAHLNPEIVWDMQHFVFEGTSLGYIYTHPSRYKPVMVVQNAGDLHAGEVYYRYRGQSSRIKYPELERIIADRVDMERKAWIQHLNVISTVGPTNAAVIDTVRGRIFGGKAPFLIDEKLLRELKFIKEGNFSETQGSPTLKLIGELTSISGVVKEKPVHKGIHFDDMITAFLSRRQLGADEAKSYFIEAVHQPSQYTPVFYFIQLAKLSRKAAKEMLKEEATSFPTTKAKLIERIGDTKFKLPKYEAFSDASYGAVSKEEFVKRLANSVTAKDARSYVCMALRKKPEYIAVNLDKMKMGRILEAILCLKKVDFANNGGQIAEILLKMFTEYYDFKMDALEKSLFRKGISYFDHEMNSDSVVN